MIRIPATDTFENETITFNNGYVFRIEYTNCEDQRESWTFDDPNTGAQLVLEFGKNFGALCSATFIAANPGTILPLKVGNYRFNPREQAPDRPKFELLFPAMPRRSELASLSLAVNPTSLMLAIGPVVEQAGAAEGNRASFIWKPSERLNLIYVQKLNHTEHADLLRALGQPAAAAADQQ